MPVSRRQIIAAVHTALEPLPHVLALSLGGSEAFGRADALSDIDLTVVVEPDTVAATFAACEQALEMLSPIDLRLHIPEPAWHGHSQRFYRLRDADPLHHVDLFVQTHGVPPLLNELEHHGRPTVLFDKVGAVQPAPIDAAALDEKLRARRAYLTTSVLTISP